MTSIRLSADLSVDAVEYASRANVYKACDDLTSMGFLIKAATGGYRAVPGMKVNIVEK